MTEPLLVPSEVLGFGSESYLGTGAVLWREGESGGHVALVLSGTLEVFRDSEEGEVILDVVEPGAAVGEVALHSGNRTASVRARTPAHLLSMGAAEFRQLLHDRPDLLEKLYWLQVNRFRSVSKKPIPTPPVRRVLDPLTKAYSYAFFTDRLELELYRARHAGNTLGLLLCDVDDFRSYQDRNGDDAADKALESVARVLQAAVTRGDLVARYGGGHFAVLSYGTDAGAARSLAEGIRSAVHAHDFPGAELQLLGRITMSIGVAVFPGDGTDSEMLGRAADLNLHRASEQGGNRVEH